MLDALTRFIFETNKFSVQHIAVKPKAFLPPPNNKTSVIGISGLNDDEVWEIGIDHVAKLRQQPLKARGDISNAAVVRSGLTAVPDGEGHPRHANLEGWPDEKENQMSIAQDLAAEATLHIVPDAG